MWKKALILLLNCLTCVVAFSRNDRTYPEEQVVSFPSKSYDFGDILLSDGPVRCSFSFTNKADFPIQIFNIVSSCGCTKPTWTEGFVEPGGKGTVNVVFNNNQGPYPFDKTLTVYISNLDKPVLLHVRGVSHEKMKPLEERFPFHIGKIGLRNMESAIGNVEQGRAKSDRIKIANLGRRSVEVKVVPLTPGFSATVSPEPIPAHSVAELNYSVDTRRTDGLKWGKEQFLCQFEVDGERYPDTFKVNIFIRDDFSQMDAAALERAACVGTDKSYYEFNEVDAGKAVTATFSVRNIGRSDMIVHKIECDDAKVRVLTAYPLSLKPGATAVIKARVDTRREPGEVLSIISVLTNSPSKPVLKLFISGNIK